MSNPDGSLNIKVKTDTITKRDGGSWWTAGPDKWSVWSSKNGGDDATRAEAGRLLGHELDVTRGTLYCVPDPKDISTGQIWVQRADTLLGKSVSCDFLRVTNAYGLEGSLDELLEKASKKHTTWFDIRLKGDESQVPTESEGGGTSTGSKDAEEGSEEAEVKQGD